MNNDNVVRLMIRPKEVTTNIGKHKLVMRFDPSDNDDTRWKWNLKVVVTYEYSGAAVNPAMCKVAAQDYVDFHEGLRSKTNDR
jgi:hypothetical protein